MLRFQAQALPSRFSRSFITRRTAVSRLPRHDPPTGPVLSICARTLSLGLPRVPEPLVRPGPAFQLRRHPGRVKQLHSVAAYPARPGIEIKEGTFVDAVWLRDACQCSLCVDPDSGQKSFATTDLPDEPVAQSCKHNTDGSLSVTWKNDPLTKGGIHESTYTHELLVQAATGATGRDKRSRVVERVLWDRAAFEAQRPSSGVSFDDWTAGGQKFWDALAQLNKTGLVFLHGVPESETSVEAIGEQIGHLQKTFYGLTWNVISKPNAENVAYTNHFLGLHQDLLYYRDCPRIQILHCLANDCDGGESLFSDGVRSATWMSTQEPEHYQALGKIQAGYHYDKHGHHYSRVRPTIEEDAHGRVPNVWWSPPFQDVFPDARQVRAWRRAAKVFQESIESEENMYEYKMRPGECVIFDNWRVLHGRRHFNTSQGKRWLKGAYVSDQVFRGRTTHFISEYGSHWTEKSGAEIALDERLQVKGRN